MDRWWWWWQTNHSSRNSLKLYCVTKWIYIDKSQPKKKSSHWNIQLDWNWMQTKKEIVWLISFWFWLLILFTDYNRIESKKKIGNFWFFVFGQILFSLRRIKRKTFVPLNQNSIERNKDSLFKWETTTRSRFILETSCCEW